MLQSVGLEESVRVGVCCAVAMASYEEVGIGDAVLLDEISVPAFVKNLQVR